MGHHFQKFFKGVWDESPGNYKMLNKLTQGIDFQGQALTLRSERQRLLASNIANVDTPGFLARDINFSQALKQAAGELKQASGMTVSSSGHIDGSSKDNLVASNMNYAAPSQLSPDGNSVDMDRERASMADNSIKYEATLRFINSHVKTMIEAIKGQ